MMFTAINLCHIHLSLELNLRWNVRIVPGTDAELAVIIEPECK
jgi:hypothetical protein